MRVSVNEIAKLVEGKILRGPEDRNLTNIGALEEAQPEDLSFFGNAKYGDALRQTSAGAVLVPLDCDIEPEGAAIIAVENPVLAFDVVIRKFGVEDHVLEPGIHPSAHLAPDVELDASAVQVGPGVVIESGCRIGDGTIIGANSTIGMNSTIGTECRLYAQVALREGSVIGDRVILHSGAVIGADGYGYEFVDGRHMKIRQAGNVEIHDDVEIGANTTIDRARFGSTVIGEGTKVDNQVQIGHNAKIGKHCLIVAQTGMSGSSQLGDYCVVAAQSGIAGHLSIAAKTTLGARSGVIADIHEAGGTYFGYPAKAMKDVLKLQMYQKKIPSLLKRVKELEARVKEMESS
tara:strand:- start:4884 stop:5924 length:1041 start_codon:yes stop_codon:yes gene_type:complete